MSMPSEQDEHLGVFDRFADWVNGRVSRAPFFAMCVLVVLLWAPSYFLIKNIDSWQLIINTTTTIITFLLVALLQNTQKRGDDALQQKLNAIANFLASDRDAESRDELCQAVGLEQRESS